MISQFLTKLLILITFLFMANSGFSFSWIPKPIAGFTAVGPKIQSCKNKYLFFDTSKVNNPCNTIGDTCDKIVNYFWDFGDGREKSNLKNPEHEYKHNGFFIVKLRIETELGFNDSSFFYIKINGPSPFFKPYKDTVIYVNDSINFVNLSEKPKQRSDTLRWNSSWEWDFGDNSFISTMHNVDTVGHRYKKVGIYNVFLWQFATIPNTSVRCPVFYPDTSITELKLIRVEVKKANKVNSAEHSNISIYPNPASLEIYISQKTGGKIVIFDINGKLLLKQNTINSQPIDISFLKPGVYFVNYISEERNYYSKFIKIENGN